MKTSIFAEGFPSLKNFLNEKKNDGQNVCLETKAECLNFLRVEESSLLCIVEKAAQSTLLGESGWRVKLCRSHPKYLIHTTSLQIQLNTQMIICQAFSLVLIIIPRGVSAYY